MSDQLSAISTATGIATSVLGKLNPVLGLVSSQVSVPAAMATLMNDIATGNLSDTEMGMAGLGTVPASSSVLTLTARTLGLLALGGLAVGATTAGLAGGLALGVGVAAALASPAVKDILTDPNFWDSVQDGFDDPSRIREIMGDYFKGAQRSVPRRDPLTLDLDGDGLETVGFDPSHPVYFDHDLNGIKEGTGWVKPDDGFLVLDRNGNGVIDNGAELFGDHTPLSGGGYAADGFAALVQEDTNSDGKVNAADARFSQLRVWRDLNQDGISQADELSTLAANNIAALNVAKTENSTLLANGNVIADLGTYIKTDGSTGALGDTAQLGDLDLAENTFVSQFTDSIPLTAEAEALPDMQGSGQVRDLREAASLSATLATTLGDYAAATTRDAQQAQLDALIEAWSDTSTFAATATGAYAGHDLTVNFAGITNGSVEYQAWLDKLTVLERFNGLMFQEVLEAANADLWGKAA